jgi:hypothetical protein
MRTHIVGLTLLAFFFASTSSAFFDYEWVNECEQTNFEQEEESKDDRNHKLGKLLFSSHQVFYKKGSIYCFSESPLSNTFKPIKGSTSPRASPV